MTMFDELRAIILDNSRSREERLLAFWTLSAEHWRQRMHRMMAAEPSDLEGDDKITVARRAAYERDLLRKKAARHAGGLKKHWKITGKMAATENGDSFHSHICEHCGTPYTPNKPYGRPQMYCSPACKTAAYRVRKAA